jgi:uncharacterized membrane protein
MTVPSGRRGRVAERIRARFNHNAHYYGALAAGAVVWVATFGQHEPLRVLLAADVFFAAYIVLMVRAALRMDPATLRSLGAGRSAEAGSGVAVVSALTFIAMLLSLWAIFLLLNHPKEEGRLFPALAVASVPLSWAMTHTLAAFQYARLYYAPGPDGTPAGGFDFRGDEPDGVDFLYQAFAVGASFSVSDVAVSSRPMRRAILVHSLAAFAYNTVLVAIAVNAALTFVT